MKQKLKIKNKNWMNFRIKLENLRDSGGCNRFKMNS